MLTAQCPEHLELIPLAFLSLWGQKDLQLKSRDSEGRGTPCSPWSQKALLHFQGLPGAL